MQPYFSRQRIPFSKADGPLPCRRAFTLVELLAVIVIISVLAVLLFPAIKGLPARANTAKCAGNLRQIGAGMAGYSGDNNGLMPPRAGTSQLDERFTWYWTDFVLSYIDPSFKKNTGSAGSAGVVYYNNNGIGRGFYLGGGKEIRTSHPIFDCPGLPNPIRDDEGKPYSTGSLWQYRYNSFLSAIPRAKIEKPSRLIAVMDTDSIYVEYFGVDYFDPQHFVKDYIPAHHGGFHALYVDGHVSWENLNLITDYKQVSSKWILPWQNSTEEFPFPSR